MNTKLRDFAFTLHYDGEILYLFKGESELVQEIPINEKTTYTNSCKSFNKI